MEERGAKRVNKRSRLLLSFDPGVHVCLTRRRGNTQRKGVCARTPRGQGGHRVHAPGPPADGAAARPTASGKPSAVRESPRRASLSLLLVNSSCTRNGTTLFTATFKTVTTEAAVTALSNGRTVTPDGLSKRHLGARRPRSLTLNLSPERGEDLGPGERILVLVTSLRPALSHPATGPLRQMPFLAQ